VVMAPLPDGVVDKGKYEASVYAYVATSKYCDHLPLHRIQGMLTRVGAHLAKQSMWDMLARLDELVAQPVLAEMRRQLLEEPFLQADETPIRVQVEGTKGTKTGTLWAWRNPKRSEVEKVIFDFRPDRSARGPDQFLGSWTGTLLTDGYDGFNPTARKNEIVRAGCWAHARRKFRDALDSNACKAATVLQPIQRLFWIERAVVDRARARGLSDDELRELRLEVRQRLSKRVLAAIYERAFVLDEDASVTQGSLLGKAVRYLINQREPLLAHVSIPAIPIHNNDTERDLRHVVTGRKNWQVFGSPRGGQVGARLFSLVLSAKLAGVNVQEYLEDVLGQVSTVKAKDVAELTPWGWAAERERSGLAG
jgi:transposase